MNITVTLSLESLFLGKVELTRHSPLSDERTTVEFVIRNSAIAHSGYQHHGYAGVFKYFVGTLNRRFKLGTSDLRYRLLGPVQVAGFDAHNPTVRSLAEQDGALRHIRVDHAAETFKALAFKRQ